jgi:hypothetical protein
MSGMNVSVPLDTEIDEWLAQTVSFAYILYICISVGVVVML